MAIKSSDPRHAGFMAIQDHINQQMGQSPLDAPGAMMPASQKAASPMQKFPNQPAEEPTKGAKRTPGRRKGAPKKRGPYDYLQRDGEFKNK